MPPTCGTVLLRPFTDADVAMVRDLATDPYVPTIGSLPPDADEVEALGYVARDGAAYSFVPELWVAAQ